jgi:soluble lytic murein transglycosylase-like protein
MAVFDRWAGEYNVPADLVKALTWFESGWNNDLTSSAGAIGIGQVLPITASFISETLVHAELDLNDPDDNIQLSTRYLRYLLDNNDDVRFAVASYYQGLTATRQHGIYSGSEFYVDGVIALRARFE